MPQRDAPQRPFGGVSDVFSELSRMRDIGTHGREHQQEVRERTHASAWVPVTDIVAQGDDLLIRVELAGVHPDDVHLGFSHGILTVSGSRRSGLRDESLDNFYVRERFYGEFRRSFTLAETVEPSQITAEFDNGLVEILVTGGSRQSDHTRIEIKNRSSGTATRTLA
ncbi:MAG TPA: Hsp20/alpha crystallin family protein [Nocardioidaceae bacterium]|jgi:HSP20 family protein|nr:Hsp20/alpha crystallin family protein [Nocardioidaceae bacterium]